MNAYVWHGLSTGAYHGDGTAVVIAKNITQARKLLADADPDADGWGVQVRRCSSKGAAGNYQARYTGYPVAL